MKLHLPASLFRSLLAAMSAAAALTCSYTTDAATLHPDVSVQTYTDFAQNRGRYAVGNTNALLDHIREQDGGIKLTYTGGQAPIVLTTPMIDFGAVSHSGTSVAMGLGWMATAAHNTSYWAATNADFSRYTLPDGHGIQYYGIEYTSKTETVFRHKCPTADFKLIRMSKLVTDVEGVTPYGAENPGGADLDSAADLKGQYLYHAGGGTMYQGHHDGSNSYLGPYYTYTTGAVHAMSDLIYNTDTGDITTLVTWDLSAEGINTSSPLPYNAEAGDSGSGAWAWNELTGQYEYLSSHHGSGGNLVHGKGNNEWAVETMAKYDVAPTLAAGTATIYLNKIDTPGTTATANGGAGVSGTDYSGAVTDAAGNELARYNGVQTGINLWNDLSPVKDLQTWYTYGDTYLNARADRESDYELTYADIFNSSNLVLSTAEGQDTLNVVLNDTVDLGIGYVQFKPREGQESAHFVVSSEGAEGNLLNAAGFVVEKGASVHLQLTNPANYMREWRKVGAGELFIEGSGNNDIFLNVGGEGKTHLNRDGGYAAYNVLVNNGATIVISDTEQIARDLTIGNGGGVLDMNGQSMLDWNNGNTAGEAGFTIHALDEQAIITNNKPGITDPIKGDKPSFSELTWTQGGEHSWLGSFVDTENGALLFRYQGGEGGRLTMHSIHTDLSHHKDDALASGMEVWSGTLALEGTNTIHALGSESGANANRYAHADDWHYADATTNVTVLGGTFELGSHARLTGDVTVLEGSFVMREGVKHQMEYIEGGYEKENTDTIRTFFGLKGNVELNNSTAAMKVQFSEGTDSTLVYGYNISGAGSLSVDAGVNANLSSGTLRLEGDNSLHTGAKSVISGGLYATSEAALGNTTTHKWVVEEKGWLASDIFTTADIIREHIDASSTGVVALTSTITDAIAQNGGHEGLIVGAAEGLTVHYGTATQSLEAIGGKWTLGGGGGNLIVDFLLEGANTLVLGNAYGKGNVHLANTGNTFSGGISFVGGVTLTAAEGALGNSAVENSYTNRVACGDSTFISTLAPHADGVLLMDFGASTDLNLSSQPDVYLGSVNDCRYTGNISLAEGAAYRFGGSGGVFTVESQLESGHDVVIDGQTYEGGTVVLTNAQAVNGNVSVMGRDTARTSLTEGTATLGFEGDNALANAASFTVTDGGTIDIMGTRQQLNNLTLGVGGTLADASGNGVATLSGEVTLEGTVSASQVVKTGDGHLSLGGTNTAKRFEIQGGTAKLENTSFINANGTLAISNATLDLVGQEIAVQKGTLELGDGAQLISLGKIGNTIHVVGDSTGTALTADGALLNRNIQRYIGVLNVDAGARLELTVGNTSLSSGIGILRGKGDVIYHLNNLSGGQGSSSASYLQSANSNFSGHLTFESDSTGAGALFNNYQSFGTGVVTFNGTQLTLYGEANTEDTAVAATLDVGSKGVTLNTSYVWFTGLSGTGNITGGTANFLGDMRSFSGNMAVPATFGGSSKSTNYHTVTGSSSPDAINLFGAGARLSNYAATYKFNYSDDVILNAQVQYGGVTQVGSGTLVLSEANTSTGTLTISNGCVWLGENGSWAGKLAGTGVLGNSNPNATISDISGYTGSFSLDQGSKLSIGSNGSKNLAVTSLSVNGVEGKTIGAELNVNTLELSGSTYFDFSANALLDENTASLILTQGFIFVEDGASSSIRISDTFNLSTGNYLLASGDWSQLDESAVTIDISDFYNSSVMTDASGLHLTISVADGIALWEGTAEQNEWNESSFGTSSVLPTNGQTVYFTNGAKEHHINISGTAHAGILDFNTSADDYELGGTGSLTANGISLRGGGRVTVGSMVNLSGQTTIAANSELVLKSFSTFASAASVKGQGTLTIDAGTETGSLTSNITGLSTLQLKSGRYEAGSSAIDAATIKVVGGQYHITGGTHSNNFELGGSGWGGEEHSDAALRIDGGTFSGAITLSADATMAVTGATTISGSLATGEHTLTKTGSNKLVLANDSSASGNLDVQAGRVEIGRLAGDGATFGTLTLRENTTLQLTTSLAKLTADTLLMENGSHVDLHHGSSGKFSANIEFDGNVSMGGSGNSGADVQGTIQGNGTLQLSATENGKTQSWIISSTISDGKNAPLSISANSNVTLSAITATQAAPR